MTLAGERVSVSTGVDDPARQPGSTTGMVPPSGNYVSRRRIFSHRDRTEIFEESIQHPSNDAASIMTILENY